MIETPLFNERLFNPPSKWKQFKTWLSYLPYKKERIYTLDSGTLCRTTFKKNYKKDTIFITGFETLKQEKIIG